MSYILDALRKADAQRERDASRGIHAQAASLATHADDTAARGRVKAAAVIGAGVVVAGLVAWYLLRAETPAPQAQVERTPQVVASPQAQPQPPTVATSISPPAPPPAPLPAQLGSPTPQQAREAAFTNQAPGASPVNTAPAAPVTSAGVAGPGTAHGVQNPAPSAPVTAGLPPDAPKIAISGGVYSPNPLQRMLIVNGQVFNEGSEVAPGLKIEAIQPRTAVLGFRGARYTVAY
jgi:general secretion pathway protein B